MPAPTAPNPFAADEFLELLSMLDVKTLARVRNEVQIAKRNAEDELAEDDLSVEAKDMLKRHARTADQVLTAIEQAGKELAEIDVKLDDPT